MEKNTIKVLMVDDNVSLVEMIKEYFKNSDKIKIALEAYDGKEGIEVIESKQNEYDIIIIDTPGTFSHLSNAGHKNADILLTPVNDSLVDIDVLANIDPNTKEIISESQYTENIRNIQKKRAELGKDELFWIVLRNRISHIDAKNKREVDSILKQLQDKIGFTYTSGIGERVVYREMFLKGLTILDLLKIGDTEISISHIAAKNELLTVLNTINIPLKQEI